MAVPSIEAPKELRIKERRGMGRGDPGRGYPYPLPSRLGDLERVVSSASGSG